MGWLNKRILASTLMETIMATVVIIVVFAMASLILNNTLKRLQRNDTYQLTEYFDKMEYLIDNKQVELPLEEKYKGFQIIVQRELLDGVVYLRFEAFKSADKKQIVHYEITSP